MKDISTLITVNKRHQGISIRWKLAAYMTVFVFFVLVITWLFQVFLLDVFFRGVKKSEMRESAEHITENFNEENIKTMAYKEAIDHSLCVIVYRVEEGSFTSIVNIDATGSNVIMTLKDERVRKYYQKASANGGSCFTNVAFGGFEVEVDRTWLWEQFEIQDKNGKPIRIPSNNVRMLHVQLFDDSNGQEYLILLDASMHPLDSTVQTLSTQYLWIAMIILCLAAITVFLLYKRISGPLVRMTASAKELAKGKYDVQFAGEGYCETRELADTLNYAASELSRLDRLQKELIANISHDLRTPLTLIKGYSEVMRDLPDENTPENMQVIIDETTRLSALVNDLLDLSKIQSGATAPAFLPFDLTECIQEVLTRYDTLVKHQGYSINFQSEAPVSVMADRKMILQVIYNLINNAINYTGENKTVTVTQTHMNNGRVRISVIDTGEGIEPQELPMIWERYYKVDKIHKQTQIGTGIGLSIVKSILDLHQAAYGVNSTIGVGSVFWFELPIAYDNFPIDYLKTDNTEDDT